MFKNQILKLEILIVETNDFNINNQENNHSEVEIHTIFILYKVRDKYPFEILKK